MPTKQNKPSEFLPAKYQITLEDAIAVAGTKASLADELGYTAGNINFWRPKYRTSPYIPLEAAVRFLENSRMRRGYRNLLKERKEAASKKK